MTEKKRTLQAIYEKDKKERMHRKKSCFYTSTINTTTTRSVAAMVVIGMVLMRIGDPAAASSSRADEANLTRLWERVTSHTETLRNINYYLKQTDIFWAWFQKNKGRLDEILLTGESSSPSDNVRLLERLDDLERKQKVRDEEMQEIRSALQQEREKTTRLEASLRHHEFTEDNLRRQLETVEFILSGAGREGDRGGGGGGGGGGGEDEMNVQTYKLMTYVRNSVQVLSDDLRDLRDDKIPELEERITQLETELVAVNRTALFNKRAIEERVTADLHELKQQTNNLTEVVDQSQSTAHEEVSALKNLLQGVVMNNVFPLEHQLADLNRSHHALSEESLEVKEEVSDLKQQIGSLSARVLPKQHGSNRGLQNQINKLQTSLAKVQGTIADLDGRISGLANTNNQQDQLEEARKEFSRLEASIERLRLRLSSLQEASGNMNLDHKAKITKLENDIADLRRYNNLTEHVRRISIPSATPSEQPIGPPGYGFEGGFGRPGNQGWSGEPGDPGSRGPPGTPGAPGVPGSRGEQGTPGAPGDRGAPGGRGAPGDRGAPGVRGTPGGRGPPGDRGAPGGRGSLGNRGASGGRGALGGRGTPGDRGAPGAPGVRGAPGGPGAPGNPGSSGVRGPSGSAGRRGAPGGPGVPGSPGRRGAAGQPGYPGGAGEHSAYMYNPSYAEYPYSATPSYGRYSTTARYGGYYSG